MQKNCSVSWNALDLASGGGGITYWCSNSDSQRGFHLLYENNFNVSAMEFIQGCK